MDMTKKENLEVWEMMFPNMTKEEIEDYCMNLV